jgi:lipoprotein-releasing system ATP-binding protein
MELVPDGQPLVELRGLTCGHRLGRPDELLVPRDVELELAAGELVALVGEGGAGKTTLLRVLAGLDPPAAGQARVAGLDLSAATARDRDAHRRLVGYVAQEPERGLWPSLTALENVLAPMLVGSADREERQRWALDLLEALRLSARARHRPAQLAGAERLRLALATGLACRPALLLVDEPAGELDPDAVRLVLFDLESLLRREGTAALIAGRGADAEPHVDRVHHLGRASSRLPLPAPEIRRGA